MPRIRRLSIEFAARCAWRATYVRWNDRQIAHIGVDPNNGSCPSLFGGVALGPVRKGFRVRIPSLSWMTAQKYRRALMPVYRLQSRFWHGVDGRFGWGTTRGAR